MSTNEEFNESQTEFHKKRWDFLRYIILLGSGSLSVLASFHKTPDPNSIAHKLFQLSIVLVGFGILTGGVALYSEVYASLRVLKHHASNLLKQSRGEPPILYASIPVPKILRVCEILCYISLMLFVIALVFYVIMS
jgi:hypothetical protein